MRRFRPGLARLRTAVSSFRFSSSRLNPPVRVHTSVQTPTVCGDSTDNGRAYAPVAFFTTGVLEVERGEVQLACPPHRRERDREILDRESGGIEDRDVARRRPAGRLPREDCAKFSGPVVSDRTSLDGVSQFAVVACLLP